MKRIFNVLKMLLFGIMPAVAGGLIVMDILYVIKNIQHITVGSGWPVVMYFVFALTEAILAIILLYGLGELQYNSKKWIAYKKEQAANNIDGSSEDNETSDEATNTSSKTRSNVKHMKF